MLVCFFSSPHSFIVQQTWLVVVTLASVHAHKYQVAYTARRRTCTHFLRWVIHTVRSMQRCHKGQILSRSLLKDSHSPSNCVQRHNDHGEQLAAGI